MDGEATENEIQKGREIYGEELTRGSEVMGK